MFLLFITYPATGYVHVVTCPTRFDRALEMICLARQPVTLRIADDA